MHTRPANTPNDSPPPPVYPTCLPLAPQQSDAPPAEDLGQQTSAYPPECQEAQAMTDKSTKRHGAR